MIHGAILTDADELAFIVSGWSSSYRTSRDLAFVQMDDYAALMHPVVRSVLGRPRAETLIHSSSVRHGFICFEHSNIGNPPLVNYVYVAQPYRHHGIARALFAAANIDPAGCFEYAARTRTSWELRGKTPLARYNPLRARFAAEERTAP